MGRSGRGHRRRAVLPVLFAVLLTAGCAASPSSAAPAATTTASPSEAAAAPSAGDGPPANARMVCSDEIRREIAEVLSLQSTPTPQSDWSDQVYTCTYTLPVGPLVLSVTVAASDGDARARLDALRTQLGAVDTEDGLGGEQAYSAPNGTVLAVKDNMVLDVDATALPDDLGHGHRSRIQVARLLAAGVFACWTGEG